VKLRLVAGIIISVAIIGSVLYHQQMKQP